MQMRLFLGLIFAFAASAASAADRDFYTKPSMADYPFSSAVVVGDTIYLSGEIGLTEDGKLAEGGVGPQTAQIFKNYEKTLAEVGSSLEDIVKCTVFLEDMAEYGDMNAAYAAALPDPKPARSTFGVDGLALGAALEIECLAIRKTE
ncbi:enamine deaminase RidA [Marinicaulis flavus]|uniref:Enamine deaminase RidA n=2 Tax=Hyphococcus luteus TaxID=2058213 RepID=A0A2S7K8Z5_9PROT|nr:enamine deaminase RidA [Marinicaulis flavus]